jgi:LytS/YehU family sensor histidine kinase
MYTASHAVFNGLSAMQHALLRHEREQGLYILNLFSSYLRKVCTAARAPHSGWMDEQASLFVYAELENLRFRPECSIETEEIKSSFQVPSFLGIPMLERQLFRALRAEGPVVLKVNTDIKDSRVQIQVLADKTIPALASLALNAEQQLRMDLFEERLQLFDGEVAFSETAKGAIMKLNKYQSL